jgi:glycosyltransferase involved in cell wall biosynthesis
MQSPTTPRFSAIIPNYNHAAFVLDTLNAAIEQTVPFDEILIIDDASTDDSVARIEARIRDVPHARLIRNPTNLGVIATSNLGLHAATGDFICYLSADDHYDRRIVAWCHALLARYPDVAMISGNASIRHGTRETLHHLVLPFSQRADGRYDRDAIAAIAKRRAFTFNMGANIIRRDAHLAAGELLPDLRWSADWFLYVLVGCRYPFGVIPHSLVTIRIDDAQYSHAGRNWVAQGPIIAAFIRMLQRDYPNEYPFFKRCALLPSYDIATLALCLRARDLRDFITPLLVWRLLTYKLLRALGGWLPAGARGRIRQWLKV